MQRAAETQRLPGLLLCALDAIKDRCPREPEAQLCRYQSDYDEEACERCWERYLCWVANGRPEAERGKYAREADGFAGR